MKLCVNWDIIQVFMLKMELFIDVTLSSCSAQHQWPYSQCGFSRDCGSSYLKVRTHHMVGLAIKVECGKLTETL